MAYVKLFGSILASTIWREPPSTRVLWITMLAMADRDGIVEGSIPGLADMARLSLDECKLALGVLSAPDPYSRTQDYGGRRIAPVRGGWQILNYEYYQEKQSAEDTREKARIRQERKRKRDMSRSSRSVTVDLTSGSGLSSRSSSSPSHPHHTLGVVRTARPIAGRPDPECGGAGEENLQQGRQSPFGAIVAAANRQGDVE